MPVMPLLDQYGEPIKKENLLDNNNLLEEQSGPSLIGARSIVTGYPTFNMHPMRMTKLMIEADQGNPMAYLEMAEQIEEKDSHYVSILGTRKRAVAQMEITVEAASEDPVDEQNAQFIRDWLKRDIIDDVIFDILDAVGKGYSVSELIWDMSESQWDIKDIKWRDPRWFIFDIIDGTTPLLRDGGQFVPLQPYKYIYHQHKAKSGLPIKGGVVRPCAWMWMFKNFGVKDWVIFSEAYGQPVRIGKYAAGTSQEDRAILKRAIANLGSDVGAIIPDTMIVEFVESAQKSGTTDMFERKGDWFDKQMSKAVLGQTTTTDALSSGLAGNQAHNDVRGDISRSDGRKLASTLNAQLVIPYLMLNKGPQKQYPRLKIGDCDDVDVAALADAAVKVVGIGGKVSGKKLVAKLGLPPAEEDDDEDVLSPPTPTPPDVPPPLGGEAELQQVTGKKPDDKLVTAAAVLPSPKPDAIGALADDLAGDWQEIMNPLEALLQKALKASSSYEDFSNNLLSLASELDMEPMTDKVSKAIFAARIAGNVGAKLEDK